jgi:hypothetical protein
MDFWEFLFFFLFIGPLLLLWAFALYDIFRRHDLSGLAKALWVVVMVVFPWIGVLVYLIMRPRGMAAVLASSLDDSAAPPPAVAPPPVATVQPPAATDPVGQLTALGDLHAKGLLTDEEFQQQKARILAAQSAASTAASGLPTVSVPTVALPPMDLPPAATQPTNSDERG